MGILKIRWLLPTLLLVVSLSVGSLYAAWSYPTNEDIWKDESILLHNEYSWKEISSEQAGISHRLQMILNKEIDEPVTINGVAYTDSDEALMAAFDYASSNKSNSWWGSGGVITLHDSSYIGTMQPTGSNANTGDVEAVKTLFGESLNSELETNQHYSLMIKRENLDGNTSTGMAFYKESNYGYGGGMQQGAEIALFSTVKPLTSAGASVEVVVTVFAATIKTDENGNYIQKKDENGNLLYLKTNDVGTTTTRTDYPAYEYTWTNVYDDGLFVGTATVKSYDGSSGTGSFDTSTWRSTEAYGTGSNKVNAGATLTRVVQAVLKSQAAS